MLSPLLRATRVAHFYDQHRHRARKPVVVVEHFMENVSFNVTTRFVVRCGEVDPSGLRPQV
jgi:hypothetical protein